MDAERRPGGTAHLAGHEVARVGYGAMQLEDADGDAAGAILRRALDLGVRVIDTAAFYGPGVVNERIREVLAPYPSDLVLATKVGATYDPDGLPPVRAAQRPEELRDEVERNLHTLGVDHLHVVHLRRADIPPGITVSGEQVVPIEDQLAELVALREAGTIGAIGLSNASTASLRTALPAGIVSVQNAYNVLLRTTEDQRVICQEQGIVWMPYFPLGSAFDQIRSVTEAPVVQQVAAENAMLPGQVALAWLLAQSAEVVLIPGTSSLAHLEENVAAGAARLTATQLAALDAAPNEKDAAPDEEPARAGSALTGSSAPMRSSTAG